MVDLRLADERPHNVSLYFLDWDNIPRSGSVTVTDADTSAVLVSQALSTYSGGLWLNLRVSGHVKITLTTFSASDPLAGAVLSGIFFDQLPDEGRESGPTELLSQVFTQGGGQGGELVSASGSTRYNLAVSRDYHTDAQGTVEAVTANNGAMQTQHATDAWGNSLNRVLGSGQGAGTIADNPFLYLGGLGYWQEADLGDLGLTYVRAVTRLLEVVVPAIW